MKTILALTDFSDNSKVALHYAAELSRKMHARMLIMHVHDRDVSFNEGYFANGRTETVQVVGDIVKQKMKELQDWLVKVDLNPEFLIKEGSMISEVVNVVKAKNVDLIVLGNKGGSNVEDIWMGNNTIKIVEQHLATVLSIPAKAVFSPWYHKTLVFATDYKLRRNESLKLLADLIRQFNMVASILHVSPHLEKISVAQVTAASYLEELFEGLNVSFDFSIDYDVMDALEKHVSNSKAAVFAMLAHNRNFFQQLFHRSLTHKAVLHSHIPLLIFPEKASH